MSNVDIHDRTDLGLQTYGQMCTCKLIKENYNCRDSDSSTDVGKGIHCLNNWGQKTNTN